LTYVVDGGYGLNKNERSVYIAEGAIGMNNTEQVPPTVVLVHGALTDASVWAEVIRNLQGKGFAVVAPAMPLRGLASDVAYLESVLSTVSGPVVLVGHSFGGAVISAVRADPLVRALVYVAAFQPDAGETAGALNDHFPGSKLGPDTTVVRPCPGGNDLYLKAGDFREVYAGDVPEAVAAVMAVTQRPIDPAALSEALPGPAAWRSIPSWALVSTEDNSLPPATLRFMAERAGSTVVEVRSSHAVPVAHPAAVTELVIAAADSVR
jgi:pimeloyl-ACP methyl ester carboxylesterase